MWSGMLSDILLKILALLNLADIAVAAAVCAPWRQAVKELAHEKRLSVRHLPWVIPSRHPETRAAALLRPLGTPTTYRRRSCIGVHQHWLAVAEQSGRLFLLHPLLRTQIALPPYYTLHRVRSYRIPYYVYKVVLSSPPTDEQCMVAIIFDIGQLAICRMGNGRWNKFETCNWQERQYEDAVFYKDELVAVDTKEHVWGFRFDSGGVANKRMLARTMWDVYYTRYIPTLKTERHLMVLSGELVMAVREWQTKRETDGDWGPFRTTSFRIMRLGVDGTHWAPVSTLDNHVMFLSRSISIAVPADEISRQFLPDCIYFADDNGTPPGQPEDMGWYHLPLGLLWPENGGGGGRNRPNRVPIFHWMFSGSKLL